MSTKNLTRVFALPCIALVTLASSLTSCYHKGLSLPANTPAPQVLVKDAAKELDSLSSVHVDIEAIGNTEDARLISLIGDVVQRPEFASQGHLKFKYEGTLMEGDYRIINNRLYINHILGPEWFDLGKASEFAEKYNIHELLGNDQGKPQLLDSAATVLAHAENIKPEGPEKLNNILTEKISGTIQGSQLTRYYPNIEKKPFPIELWIEASGQHRLVRSNIVMTKDSSSQLTMSDWDKKFVVTIPPLKKPNS